jgi:hypothetical protein
MPVPTPNPVAGLRHHQRLLPPLYRRARAVPRSTPHRTTRHDLQCGGCVRAERRGGFPNWCGWRIGAHPRWRLQGESIAADTSDTSDTSDASDASDASDSAAPSYLAPKEISPLTCPGHPPHQLELPLLREQDHSDPDLWQVSLCPHSRTHRIASLCMADLLRRLCTRSLRADDVQERVEVNSPGVWMTRVESARHQG